MIVVGTTYKLKLFCKYFLRIKIVSSANHKHANLRTGLMKYLLLVLPINRDRQHYFSTFEVIFGLSSVFIVRKS